MCGNELYETKGGNMKWLYELIESLVKQRFTGHLKVNFYEGGISNVNREQSIKPPDTRRDKKEVMK